MLQIRRDDYERCGDRGVRRERLNCEELARVVDLPAKVVMRTQGCDSILFGSGWDEGREAQRDN